MPTFIFARDALDAVLAGNKKLVVPEDARITMAAREVIQDHGLEVVYRPPAKAKDAPAPAEEPRVQTVPAEPAPKPAREVTDQDVELILTRVLNRLGLAKGEKTAPAAPTANPAEDDDLIVCRCEEITKGEIRAAIRGGMATLNGVKRVTRAGMGLCQGQTCQRLVTQILCGELGLSPADVAPTTARAPVRPVRLAALATG
jgi:bacterioferritin-associated ferredoxin